MAELHGSQMVVILTTYQLGRSSKYHPGFPYICLHIYMVDLYGFHVGKCTRHMDPMGLKCKTLVSGLTDLRQNVNMLIKLNHSTMSKQ